MPNYVFDDASVRRIARTVRRVEAASRSKLPQRRRHVTAKGRSPFTYGRLDTDLGYRGYATMRIYTGPPGAEVDTGVDITVWDRHLLAGTSLTASPTMFVTAGMVAGYLTVLVASCG